MKQTFDVCIISRGPLPPSLESRLRERLPINRLLTLRDPAGTNYISDARQELCERAETDWFVFVDDDVKIIGDPVSEATPLMDDPENGAVEVRGVQGDPSAPTQTRAYTRFSFIRKDAIRGLSMPHMKHNEDLWMDAFLKSKGWKWPMTQGNPLYIHIRRYRPSDAYELGYWNRGAGRSPFLRSWLGLFSTFPMKILKERRGRYTFTIWFRQLHYVRGVTRAQLNGYHYEQPGGLR